MKIQTMAAPAGLPKGAKQGRIIIDGLMVTEKGKTEPIMVIRGLDPSCERMVMGYLDSIHISSSYSAEFRNEAKVQAASLTAFRMQHSDGPRELDKYIELKADEGEMPTEQHDPELRKAQAQAADSLKALQQTIIERDRLKRELSLLELSQADKGIEALVATCKKSDERAAEAERRLKQGGAGEKIAELEAQVSELKGRLDVPRIPSVEQGMDMSTKAAELQEQVVKLADKTATLTTENAELKAKLLDALKSKIAKKTKKK